MGDHLCRLRIGAALILILVALPYLCVMFQIPSLKIQYIELCLRDNLKKNLIQHQRRHNVSI